MATGYWALVLHAHLPFVRHPEDPTVMEEQWLYEAITGTYLPLLQTFEGLVADHVPFRVTVSLSAPLITMLTDDLLKQRYAEHLDKLIELTEKEIERTKPEPHYQRLAHMYHDRFQSLRHTWRCHDGNLVLAFKRLQDAGRVEVITSTATHAFFPAMDRNWSNIRAQVHVAADLFEKHFGHRPRGMWLGECGYVPRGRWPKWRSKRSAATCTCARMLDQLRSMSGKKACVAVEVITSTRPASCRRLNASTRLPSWQRQVWRSDWKRSWYMCASRW